MKLYLARYAPNPRRVAMFLAEKGIADIDIVQLDLGKGEHREPAYVDKVGLALTPALELDDGRILGESRAICSYLESLHPEPNLLGVDAWERAEIEMWDRRVEILLAIPMMLWVRHSSPLLAPVERNQSEAVGAWYRDSAAETAKFFDRRLATHEFFAGPRFTVADITALAGMDFAKLMRWRPDENLPNLKRWREAMKARPAGQVDP